MLISHGNVHGKKSNTQQDNWAVAWEAYLDTNASGNGDHHWRTAIPIGVDFTQIKVRSVASTSTSFNCDNVSVGVQDTGENTVSTPKELLYSTTSGFALAASSNIVSDGLDFSGVAGDIILVNHDIASGSHNPRVKNTGGYGAWYKGSTDAYNVSSLSMTLRGADDIGGVDRVEVLTSQKAYRHIMFLCTDDNSDAGVALTRFQAMVGDTIKFPVRDATGDATPGPEIYSASTEQGGNWSLWRAFRSGTSPYGWQDDNNAIPANGNEYLAMDRGAGNQIPITGVILAAFSVALSPKSYKICCSNVESPNYSTLDDWDILYEAVDDTAWTPLEKEITFI